MAVMATGFAFTVRTELRILANLEGQAQARALAQAGIHRAMAALVSDGRPVATDGRPQPLDLGDGSVVMSLRSESGKVDLNSAPEVVLRGLFTALAEDTGALTAREAETLTDVLLDWIDEDDDRRPRGAEAADYARAGLDYGPRNADVVAVSELRRLPGMTGELYQRLAADVTVYARRAQLDPNSAGFTALRALPGLSAERVQRFLDERQTFFEDNPEAPQLPGFFIARHLGPAMRYLSAAGTSVYTVDAVGVSPDGARARLRAVLRITDEPERPVSVVAWQSGEHETGMPGETR